jgi:hypothetical protein
MPRIKQRDKALEDRAGRLDLISRDTGIAFGAAEQTGTLSSATPGRKLLSRSEGRTSARPWLAIADSDSFDLEGCTIRRGPASAAV